MQNCTGLQEILLFYHFDAASGPLSGRPLGTLKEYAFTLMTNPDIRV